MNHLLWGAFWIAAYLALVLAPLLLLLVRPTPPGSGFWWDASLALGFAATGMMGVQFVLTARFRHATAPYGIDIIYYFHRYVAYVALLLVLAHPTLLFAVNPFLVHLLNPLVAPWHMVAGVASVAALALLIVSSTWRKQLGIRYEAWRWSHGTLAAAAVTLAIAHIAGVGHYIGTSWRRVLWTTIVAAWVALLAWVRVVKPWRMLRSPYRVVDVAQERGDSWTVGVRPDGHEGLTFEPGQFAWLTIRSSPFAMREHPFSISSSPTRGERLEFTIKELGDFTRTIRHVTPGEVAYVDGPFGAFSVDRYPASGYVFIAGGIGIAPIVSMLRALADRQDRRPLLLIYANRRWERVTFREPLEELTRRLDLRVVHVLEEPPEGWPGERGRVTRALLERHLSDRRETHEYFICGPLAMTQSVEQALYRLGIPLGRSHSELFDLV